MNAIECIGRILGYLFLFAGVAVTLGGIAAVIYLDESPEEASAAGVDLDVYA